MEQQFWICPICASPLATDQTGMTCMNRHHFDRSRQGYFHLLPQNRMHAKAPGDSPEMMAARHAFLSKDFYRCLCRSLCVTAGRITKDVPEVTFLDVGCGEGYYTEALYRSLGESGKQVSALGIDLSKLGLRYAAKRIPKGQFAVASCYHLPIADGAIDLALNLFSPLAVPELSRVLRPKGYFLYAVPDARHLWQMKEILYPVPYENTVKELTYDGFSLLDTVLAGDTITVEGQADIHALFSMTPYYWRTPKAGAMALAEQDRLTTEIAFRLYLYQKN